MSDNDFERLFEEMPERIFPDWTDDIKELRHELKHDGDFSVEVVLDSKDGKRFFSLFDYQGNKISDTLASSGTVAVVSAKHLIDIYKRQMEEYQPVYRFYRIACSVADKLRVPHPEITSAPDSEFDDEENSFIMTDSNVIYFRKDTMESTEAYFELCELLRDLWQERVLDGKSRDSVTGRKIAEMSDEELGIDSCAFAALMMDVLFQIEIGFEDYPSDLRTVIKDRVAELAQELYG